MSNPALQRKATRSKQPNEKSVLLTDVENETLFTILGRGCSSLATGVVQLYLADPASRQRWSKRFCGVACFTKDNGKRSYYIRIYDIKKNQLIWEQELYNQFRYKAPREYFHTFEAEDCQAGLNFASEDEAAKFKKAVENKLFERLQKKREKKQQQRSERQPAPAHNAASPPTSGIDHSVPLSNISLNKENTQATVNKKKDKGKDKKKKKLTKEDIGTPTAFRHVSHVGWDPNKGLDMNNLEPDMKNLFESVGINSESQIDEETVDFIYDFVEKHGGLDAVKKDLASRGPPPPPPSMSGAPPPPPASRVPSTRPPPPPSRPPAGQPPPPPPSRQGAPPPPGRGRPGMGAPPPPPPTSAPPPPMKAPSGPRPMGGMAPPPPPMGGAPPPPPPPPAPAAPPPPPMGGGMASERGALLDSIQKGTTLKSVGTNEHRPAGDGRSNLLSEIRGGHTLKKVDHDSDPQQQKTEEAAGIVGALARALANRQKHIQGSDDEDDDDSDDDVDDDEEWSD